MSDNIDVEVIIAQNVEENGLVYTRWKGLLDRMNALYDDIMAVLSQSGVEVELQKRLMSELYIHGAMETNLRYAEPRSKTVDQQWESDMLDKMEPEINGHEEEVRLLL